MITFEEWNNTAIEHVGFNTRVERLTELVKQESLPQSYAIMVSCSHNLTTELLSLILKQFTFTGNETGGSYSVTQFYSDTWKRLLQNPLLSAEDMNTILEMHPSLFKFAFANPAVSVSFLNEHFDMEDPTHVGIMVANPSIPVSVLEEAIVNIPGMDPDSGYIPPSILIPCRAIMTSQEQNIPSSVLNLIANHSLMKHYVLKYAAPYLEDLSVENMHILIKVADELEGASEHYTTFFQNPNLSTETLRELIHKAETRFPQEYFDISIVETPGALVNHPNAPEDILVQIAQSNPEDYFRIQVAGRANISRKLIKILVADKNPDVRTRLIGNENVKPSYLKQFWSSSNGQDRTSMLRSRSHLLNPTQLFSYLEDTNAGVRSMAVRKLNELDDTVFYKAATKLYGQNVQGVPRAWIYRMVNSNL